MREEYEDNNYIGTFDDVDECDVCYGMELIKLTEENLEDLKAGKVLNFGINGFEYSAVIFMEDKEERQ